MARNITIDNVQDLTNNERIVLHRLFHTVPNASISADFADVATSGQGKDEWALPILKRLAEYGFVEGGLLKIGNASSWAITREGMAASRLARPAPPEMGNEAKAMLIGPFMMSKNSLRFENESQTPSPQCRTGLRDLEFLGLAVVAHEGKAEIWKLTPEGQDVDRRQLVPDVFDFMENEGKFRLAVPIEDEPESPSM